MKIGRHNFMVNNYAKKEINEVLNQREVKGIILNEMENNPNLTMNEAEQLIYNCTQTEDYKEKNKEKLNELQEQLNELIDNPKSFKGVNEELFDIVDITVEDCNIFIEGNDISFILPYPKTINEFNLTINTIKNYLQIVEEVVFYKNYSKDVQEVLNTGTPLEVEEGMF